MEFVEYKKLSKKAQKALNNEKRATWGFCPASKVVPSKKIYNRTKAKSEGWA